MMRRYGWQHPIVYALVASLLAGAVGCAGNGDAPGPPRKIAFFDSEMFDRQLREALAHEYASVEVHFTGSDVTVNRIPERLDRWLTTIDKQDDRQLAVVPDPAYPTSKGVGIGVAITLAIQGYQMYKDWAAYAPARDYNATVYYVPKEGTITRITFDRPVVQERGVGGS